MSNGSLKNLLSNGSFAVTAEILPPLSAEPETLLAKARLLKGKADAVNVTDAAGARVAMSSFAAAAILAAQGIEPVLQVTCRDRNRIALAGDLLGAAAQGVRNLLVLYGDDPGTGDMPEAKAVHDLDTRAVLTLAKRMRDQGLLPSGRSIESPPSFHLGAADTPFDPPPDWEPHGLIAKAEAGADFVQTQFCFDATLVERYLARLNAFGLPERLPILIGVGPIASARSAEWMRDNLHGVQVPQALIDRLAGSEDQAAEGRRACTEMIQALSAIPGVAGVHIMAPLQQPEVIAAVVEESGIMQSRI